MTHSKELLICSAMLMIIQQGNAENVPGRTRNLNMLRYNKYVWAQVSSSEKDNHNILHDLACNCDNSDFELNFQSTVKPFAVLNKLGKLEKLEDLEKLLDNPLAVLYMQKLLGQAERNTQAFINDNLKEMLFSRDQDGKTVSDILEEKQGSKKAGCLVLKAVCDVMKQEIVREEKRQEDKKEVEEWVNRLIQ